MRTLLVSLLLAATPASAVLQGKLDLNINGLPITVRDLHDGLWEIGGKLPFWQLTDTATGAVWAQASVFGAWRLELQDPAFGICAGVPFSALGTLVANGVQVISNAEPSAPPWLKKAATFMSLDGYVGARPHYTPPDDHRVMYGVGAQVNVTFGNLQGWAAGTPEVKDAAGNQVIPAVKGL